jgi:hypothetical protein
MTMTKIARRSFAGGEITPEMFGRIDNLKNQTGWAVPQRDRAAARPGVQAPGLPLHQRRLKDRNVRLIPFVFNTTQSMVLEFGHGYIRFHTNGGSLRWQAAWSPAQRTAMSLATACSLARGLSS